MRWAEGPVWFGDGRYLLWSDAALDRITRWDEWTWMGIYGAAGAEGPVTTGSRVFNPAVEPIGHIDLPERCANLCFGGFRRSRLFMTASHSIYSVFLRTQGTPGG
jgi:sugar lactone lactonase YvrE